MGRQTPPRDAPFDSRLHGTVTTNTPSSSSETTADFKDPMPQHTFIQFQSNTISPSPPLQSEAWSEQKGSSDRIASGSSLRISTDVFSNNFALPARQGSLSGSSSGRASTSASASASLNRKASAGSLQPVARTPSFKAAMAQALGPHSASSSVIASPIISAMGDVTPLPSPLLSADSPGPWKKLIIGAGTPPKSRGSLGSVGEEDILITDYSDRLDPTQSYESKQKSFASLGQGENMAAPNNPGTQTQHTRNRSVSEYIPEPVAIPRRHLTVSGSHAKYEASEIEEPRIRREANYAESRGITPTVAKPPTPPPSDSSKDSTDGSGASTSSGRAKDRDVVLFEARGRHDNKKRRWRAIRCLGQGTFSRVMLATSQITSRDEDAAPSPVEPHQVRKTLVAVKVCEHGPRGGASEDRIEMSLKRELEIMQSIHHPSLVDLKAWSIEPTRAILVLTYCPGGDLFDVATAHRTVLTPPLLRRLFAELVGAVRYLHEKRIVHRDIKLENVLVNLTVDELADPNADWTTYPNSIITLADFGLSRRITDDEKLETRCGSDDYAAPEVILGQPYDGRATDAWSLGVLLYALLESRLPFDPHPGMSDAHRMRSRTSHRIARVEWRWFEFAGDDGDHEGDEAKFEEKGLLGAMQITEGLLKRTRSRWPLDRVAAEPWVRDAIMVDGGLKFWEQEQGEEVV